MQEGLEYTMGEHTKSGKALYNMAKKAHGRGADLQKQLDAANRRIATLKATPPTPPAPEAPTPTAPSAQADIVAQLAAMQQQLTALSQQSGSKDHSSKA